jgi:hypothetical protein
VEKGITCCDPYDTEVLIHSPGQLAKIGKKIRAAVNDGVLRYNSFESDRELMGQPAFMTLDFSGVLPDVMRYHFHCPRCGNGYALSIEVYHGRGGKWGYVGNLPSNISAERDAQTP